MRRALLVCPGRGSYGPAELGWLARHGGPSAALLAALDAQRAARGARPVTELDAAPAFEPAVMAYGADAAALTFAATCVDLARLDPAKVRVVGALGNSMGWYSALYAAGALALADACALVETMGALQAEGSGGQLVYPLVDADWRPDPARQAALEAALVDSGARWSLRLGGVAVLAGSEAELARLAAALPAVTRGGARYPRRLPHHAAFHTALMARSAALGRERLAGLRWRSPTRSLIDGRGLLRRPRVTTGEALRDYTLDHQVVRPFDFTAALRVALRELAPEVIVLLGPGQTLGAPVGQVLAQEGWRGIRGKRDFLAAQAGAEPLVVALARPEQAALVTL